MNVGIMQPYFFPYIGYFQLINAVDKFVFYDNCQYIKGGWINRNRLLQCGGEDFYITVPLKKHSYTILISQVEIYNGVDWRRKILLSMRQNYKRAPFYGEIYPIIENLFSHSYDSISILNSDTITAVCKLLDITTELISSFREEINTSEEESFIDKFLYEPEPPGIRRTSSAVGKRTRIWQTQSTRCDKRFCRCQARAHTYRRLSRQRKIYDNVRNR